MKGTTPRKAAFAILLGISILVILLYSCSIAIPIINGPSSNNSDQDEDDMD